LQIINYRFESLSGFDPIVYTFLLQNGFRILSALIVYNMATKVSEKAIYKNWEKIPDGKPVSIISKEFTIFNTERIGTDSIDDTKFLTGTLVSSKVLDSGGYGGSLEYTVKLDDGNDIVFTSSPRSYFF